MFSDVHELKGRISLDLPLHRETVRTGWHTEHGNDTGVLRGTVLEQKGLIFLFMATAACTTQSTSLPAIP